MKKMLLLFLTLVVCSETYSQTWYDNYQKYWWYRYRLVNDFMKIGPSCGESIPATQRRRDIDYGGKTAIPTANGALTWGDATEQLGHYLSVLGTEYHILNKNGWYDRRTREETKLALDAFYRLDNNTEAYCIDLIGLIHVILTHITTMDFILGMMCRKLL